VAMVRGTYEPPVEAELVTFDNGRA
jgi:hypothetical protein